MHRLFQRKAITGAADNARSPVGPSCQAFPTNLQPEFQILTLGCRHQQALPPKSKISNPEAASAVQIHPAAGLGQAPVKLALRVT